MVLEKLFGSSNDGNSEKHGVVWASFQRKYETWHFGPNDDKEVVYDGNKDDVLYRFADDDSDTGRSTSYGRVLKGNYKIELFAEDLEQKWKEKRREEKTMYLVAKGSWDGENLRYSRPVLVVEKSVFEKLKDEADLAHKRSMTAEPRRIYKEIRGR